MRRVGLIDITVGNATRLGASQRSTTRPCASHHISTQRANRWGHPAALARLARTVTLKRLWLRDGHVQRAHSLSPNPGRNASPICPDLINDRHRRRLGLFTNSIYFQVPDGGSLGPEHKYPQFHNEGIGALRSETAAPALPQAKALLRTE